MSDPPSLVLVLLLLHGPTPGLAICTAAAISQRRPCPGVGGWLPAAAPPRSPALSGAWIRDPSTR